MIDFPGDLLTLVGCATLAISWGATTVSWRVNRRLRSLQQTLLAQASEDAALRGELAGIGAAITTLALRFDRLSAQLAIDARHASSASVGEGRELDLAVRGARQGVSEDDLVAEYGMSRQEAAFLRRLHAGSPPALGRRAIA
jgi:hypothetical protein